MVPGTIAVRLPHGDVKAGLVEELAEVPAQMLAETLSSHLREAVGFQKAWPDTLVGELVEELYESPSGKTRNPEKLDPRAECAHGQT
jgi:hypothetical protein